MPQGYGVRRFLLAASITYAAMLYSEPWLLPAHADEAADALQKCDTLASHPHDPDRRASGVTDDQMIPAAAIDACKSAAALNPTQARASFELGRAEFLHHDYNDAFRHLASATDRGYAPAMKYLGDMYLQGVGLPPDKHRDGHTAYALYQRSAQGGFADGSAAADKLGGLIEEATFDASIFQNPVFISKIYHHDDTAVNRTDFLLYIDGFAEKIGGVEPYFTNGQRCAPQVAATTTSGLAKAMAQIGLNTGNSLLQSFGDMSNIDSMINNSINTSTRQVKFIDQGGRDALALNNRYHCGDVTHTILESINLYFDPGRGSVHSSPAPETQRHSDGPPAAAQASFTCNADSKPDEMAICRSPVLAHLDQLTSSAFNEALHTPGNRQATLKYDRGVLAERRSCGSDASCIKRVQLSALRVFRSLGSSVQDP